MNNTHRVLGSKPDLPIIEFSPSTTALENKSQPTERETKEIGEQEDIFDWLSSH